MEVRCFEIGDTTAVVELWHLCGLARRSNDPIKDIARKLKVDDEMFLVGLADGQIVGSIMAGYDGHRGWINYLAVHPDHRRGGFAARLMNEAERLLRAVGCPKINLQVRSTNTEALGFYHRIGYEADEVLSFGKRLEDDG